jgi:hypothetical protein
MLMPDQHSLEGSYRYRLNGEVTQLTENFVINRLGTGRYLANSARMVAGEVRLKARSELVNGALQRGSFEWIDELGSIKRNYEAEDDLWLLDGNRIDVPEHTPLFGLLRVFTGPLLLAILERDGQTRIVTPSLSAQPDRDQLLQPLVSERTVQDLGIADMHTGKQSLKARKMTFSGGPYEQASLCWVDEQGVLLGYDWEQPGVGQWQVRRSF